MQKGYFLTEEGEKKRGIIGDIESRLPFSIDRYDIALILLFFISLFYQLNHGGISGLVDSFTGSVVGMVFSILILKQLFTRALKK